jgi:inner membrane protease subunit 2
VLIRLLELGAVVLAERSCLQKYQFSHGDVVLFKCPSDHRELFVKRLIALPGEWMQLPGTPDIIKIPEGHCWVEGDNAACSWDSRSFGPVSYFCSFSCLIPVQHATLISHKFG